MHNDSVFYFQIPTFHITSRIGAELDSVTGAPTASGMFELHDRRNNVGHHKGPPAYSHRTFVKISSVLCHFLLCNDVYSGTQHET